MCRFYDNIKLFVVEGNSSLNKALTHFICDKLGLEVVGTSQSYDNLIRNRNLHFANLILLDTSLPNYKCLDVVNHIFYHNHRQNIIGLSAREKPICLETIILLGFKGVVFKDKIFGELDTAIKAIVEGKMYFPPEIKDVSRTTKYSYGSLVTNRLNQF